MSKDEVLALFKNGNPADSDIPAIVLLEDYNISLYFFRNSIYKGALPPTHTLNTTEKLQLL